MPSGYFGKQGKLFGLKRVGIYLIWEDKVIFLRSNSIVAVKFLNFVRDYFSTKLQLSEKQYTVFVILREKKKNQPPTPQKKQNQKVLSKLVWKSSFVQFGLWLAKLSVLCCGYIAISIFLGWGEGSKIHWIIYALPYSPRSVASVSDSHVFVRGGWDTAICPPCLLL